jgi:hypothetical protein
MSGNRAPGSAAMPLAMIAPSQLGGASPSVSFSDVQNEY